MVPYSEIDKDAPFSTVFKDTGMAWASYIVSVGALFGETLTETEQETSKLWSGPLRKAQLA